MTRGPSTPLVVVLSERTAEHVRTLAESGWDGPVLLVGSVSEARQVIASTTPLQTQSRVTSPRPAPSRPTAVPASVTGQTASTGQTARGEEVVLRLDVDRQRVVHGSRAARLTPLEFGVLEALLRTPGRVHRYAELTRGVWGTAYTGDASSLHAVVRRLRRKLEAVRAPVELEAVRGIGFRLGRPEAPSTARPDLAGVAVGG